MYRMMQERRSIGYKGMASLKSDPRVQLWEDHGARRPVELYNDSLQIRIAVLVNASPRGIAVPVDKGSRQAFIEQRRNIICLGALSGKLNSSVIDPIAEIDQLGKEDLKMSLDWRE